MIGLQQGSLRCTVNAQAGGSVVDFWLGEHAVFSPLRSLPPRDARSPISLPSAGSYPLVPYSNRIGHAKLNWRGQTYALQPNFPPEPHSIHGVGWQRAWDILDNSQNQATLQYIHFPDEHWPFAFEAMQSIALSDDTLSMRLALKNLADCAAPIGVGWHPYFIKRASTRIAFVASGRWEMDSDHLPTHCEGSSGMEVNCADLRVDHCFEGWRGALKLSDEHMQCEVQSNLSHLVVYTRPEINAIAIEPVSHANNALNMFASGGSAEALGVRILLPGESYDAWMSVTVTRTH